MVDYQNKNAPAETTLAEPLDTSETVVTVADATQFSSSPQFPIKVEGSNEIMLVTGISGNDLTVTRGAEGTAATIHSSGAAVRQVLTKASLEATAALSLIERVVVGVGGVASVSFSSIPNTYEDLRLVIMGSTSAAVTENSINLRFNADSGANYDYQQVFAVAAVEDGFGAVAQTSIPVASLSGTTSPANAASQAVVDILSYARTVFQKNTFARYGTQRATTNTQNIIMTAGWWRSTVAITQITLTPASGNFVEGTVVSLYGLR